MIIYNIAKLLQVREGVEAFEPVKGLQMAFLPTIENAWIRIVDGIIQDYGTMHSLNLSEFNEETLDANEGIIGPSYVDSHTHLVFARTRESEFVDKIKGATYAEIAAKGGGILNSANALAEMTEDELFEVSFQRLKQVIQYGTGAIEIKSGYGLTLESELKMLRVIKRLKNEKIIPVKATFLGAHAVPKSYNGDTDAYVHDVIHTILPKVVEENLAEYIDVFCETGFFNEEQTERIIQAGAKYGLKAKIHANQLNNSGGIQVGVRNNAISVDHLETMGTEEVEVLKSGHTIPTLLPGAAFFLRMSYPPARELLNANLPVCVASDFNPGSCPCGNMNTIFSLSCIQMKMTPEEVYNAITINGAAALEELQHYGSITKGKKANLIFYKNHVKTLEYIPYSYGENCIEKVMIEGQMISI